MTDDEVHSAVVRWVAGLTGIETIRMYSGGDEPTIPYIAVNFTGSDPVRRWASEIKYREDEASGRVAAAPVMEVEWRFSVHCYGDASTDYLRRIVTGEQLAQINEPLMPALIVHDVSQVRNIPELIKERWEQRSQIDLFVRGIVKDEHLIDTIEQYGFEFERNQ